MCGGYEDSKKDVNASLWKLKFNVFSVREKVNGDEKK